jgi:hypothetical protein
MPFRVQTYHDIHLAIVNFIPPTNTESNTEGYLRSIVKEIALFTEQLEGRAYCIFDFSGIQVPQYVIVKLMAELKLGRLQSHRIEPFFVSNSSLQCSQIQIIKDQYRCNDIPVQNSLHSTLTEVWSRVFLEDVRVC